MFVEKLKVGFDCSYRTTTGYEAAKKREIYMETKRFSSLGVYTNQIAQHNA
jgi:hypothetical protein